MLLEWLTSHCSMSHDEPGPGHACMYGVSSFWYFWVRFKCALNSAGDYWQPSIGLDLTTEGLEPYRASPWRTCYVFADAARGQAKNPKVKFCKVYVLVFMDCATQDCGSTSLAVAMVAPTTYLAFIWNVKGKGQLPISIFLPLWSGFMGVFLHARRIPHHNLRRQFWASVWYVPCSNWINTGHGQRQPTIS